MNVIEKIASDLKLDKTYISRIADRSSFYYKDYTIPRRNGKPRHISQPSPELKTLQYWVLYNILMDLPVSEASYAYKKGDSIKKHAELHSRSRFFLHADICNFFPSIKSAKLSTVLLENRHVIDALGLDLVETLQDIRKICFKRDSLCIGAVSSPAISNIVMYSFDKTMLEYCNAHGYLYSRYADDIYISSSSYIPSDVLSFLQKELDKCGFVLNYGKTGFCSSKSRRKVTGLVITNDSRVSVGTETRNSIKKMVYDKIVHGKGNPNQILGYLSFLKDIEPHTYNNIIIKYSQYCSGDLIKELSRQEDSPT